MTKIMITGGAGFAGHHTVEHFLKHTDWEIVVLDKLNYATPGWDRLRDIDVFDDKRVSAYSWDLAEPIPDGMLAEIGRVETILHMAGETHVDRSIVDPRPFVLANVLGTMNILNYALAQQDNLRQFVYFSTDEVFGPAPEGVAFDEWARYNSGNPYAATKAGGEELAMAYANTYKLPVLVTHTMNLFGERQHPEKFIPSTLLKVLARKPVIIHANSDMTKSGSRFYIHCRNMASGLLYLLQHGQHLRTKMNIVGEREVSNLELAQMISEHVGVELEYKMVDFHSSRPGHDLRYALSGSKLATMGWEPPKTFEQSLAKTLDWMMERPEWLKA